MSTRAPNHTGHVPRTAHRLSSGVNVKKNCVICGAEFDARGADITCGKKCSAVRASERASKYRERNPESFKGVRRHSSEKLRHRMGLLGFRTRSYFVHDDDAGIVSDFIAKLRAKRIARNDP